jgi:hypothetical protein
LTPGFSTTTTKGRIKGKCAVDGPRLKHLRAGKIYGRSLLSHKFVKKMLIKTGSKTSLANKKGRAMKTLPFANSRNMESNISAFLPLHKTSQSSKSGAPVSPLRYEGKLAAPALCLTE